MNIDERDAALWRAAKPLVMRVYGGGEAALWRVSKDRVLMEIAKVGKWDGPGAHPFAKLAEPIIAALAEAK